MLECRLLSRVWVIVFHNSFLHENHVDSRLRCYADLDVLRCYSLRCILKVYSIYRWVILVYNCLLGTVPLFSSPDPKGHVSYCQHLASVVRRKRFQKSSPLKVLDQWKPHLVWIITRGSSFKIVSDDAVHQPTWPLLLKIEHMVKLQVLGNNSKTVNNIKNLTEVKVISTSRSTYPAILK
jgi:hypothetical protein